MSDNEWRRMYEGRWDAVDKGGSSLTIDDLEKAAEKARALPRPALREVVITKLVADALKITLKETRGLVLEDAVYVLIHPATWARWRSEMIEIETPGGNALIGVFSGLPVIESDDRARELLLEALEMYQPTPHPIYWSPGA